jgi:hypothetical protein
MRMLIFFLLGMEGSLLIIHLLEKDIPGASNSITILVYMSLTLLFESKAHQLKEEKDNLIKFLNNPGETK